MKIALSIDSFYPCIDGPINVTSSLAEIFNRSDSCSVLAPGAKGKYTDSFDYEVLRCRSISAPEKYRYALPLFDSGFRKKVAERQFDIFHAQSPFVMGRYAIRMAKRSNVPVIATFHTRYYDDFLRCSGSESIAKTLTRKIVKTYECADEVWTVSKAAQKTLRDYGYTGESKIVRNGTDMVYPNDDCALVDKINEKHKLKGRKNVFLYVGRIAAYKNLDMLIGAFKLLKHSGTEFTVLIVGGGFDEQSFKKKVKESGLSDRFIFVGTVSDRKQLQGYYLRCDALVFPSTFDTASLAPIEAAAHKKPSFVVRESGSSESITDGRNGFLCEETDVSMSKTILFALPYLKAVGENAYKDVYRSWETVAKEIRPLYDDAIAEYGKKSIKNSGNVYAKP